MGVVEKKPTILRVPPILRPTHTSFKNPVASHVRPDPCAGLGAAPVPIARRHGKARFGRAGGFADFARSQLQEVGLSGFLLGFFWVPGFSLQTRNRSAPRNPGFSGQGN